ncbi:MAG: hypothetical protein Q7R35_06575 [Elusimicrobiota bacterium]|nr:hypothetical protein [Elusimicrobiota bacterium]
MNDMEIKPENKPVERPSYQSMRAAGIFLLGVAVLAGMATFKEGHIIGAGLGASGVLFWLAGFGGGRGWRFFPVAPVTAATIALLLMCYSCFGSLAAH